jgi:hypothetical protein
MVVVLGTMLIVGCSTRASTFPATAEQFQVMPEEYAIYSSVISAQWHKADALFVIRDRTGSKHFQILDEPLPTEEQLPEVRSETLAGFQAANKQEYLLGNEFIPKRAYLLLSQEELGQLFPNERWLNFYNKYPTADGIWTLSRVGFSPDSTQALVYYEHACGLVCGAGFWSLLAKQADSWVVQSTIMVWIS